MQAKAVIFDLDGTLLYTLEDLKNSVNFALKECGLKERSQEEIKEFVGNGIRKLIELSCDKHSQKVEMCLKFFKEHYSKNSTITTKPYDRAIETLKKLKEKGFKLALLSNKIDSEVKKLSKVYFNDIFDVVLGETREFLKKPDPKSTLYIIKKLKLNKDEVVFVGDSEVDINTSKNAKITCCSVSWGYKDKDFLYKSGAKRVFDDFDELYDFIISDKGIF